MTVIAPAAPQAVADPNVPDSQAFRAQLEQAVNLPVADDIEGLRGALTAFTDVRLGGFFDPETALLSVFVDRVTALDSVIANRVQDAKARNAELRELNGVLTVLAQVSEDEEGVQVGANAEEGARVLEVLRANGIDTSQFLEEPDERANAFAQALGEPAGIVRLADDGDLELLKETVNSRIQERSSNSQLDQLELQGLLNQRQQALTAATNVLQRLHDTAQQIINNFR